MCLRQKGGSSADSIRTVRPKFRLSFSHNESAKLPWGFLIFLHLIMNSHPAGMEDAPSSSWLWLFVLSAACVATGLAPVLALLAAAIAPTVIFVAASSSTGAKQEQQLTAAAVSCRPTGQETVSTTATTLRPHQGIESSARALPQVAKGDPAQLAAERLASGGATGAPPCAGCCQGSSSCPWHLPMALSLNLWGQDSFRFTCSKRASDTGRGSSFSTTSGSRVLDQQYPADAFTFASTVHTGHETWEVPTTPGLLRSLSAPAAATAAGPARLAAEHMPAHSSADVLSFGPRKQQVQDMPAQTAGHSAAAPMSSTTAPWASTAGAACQGSLAPIAGPDLAIAPAAAVTMSESGGFPAAGDDDAATPRNMPMPQPQQPSNSVLDWQEPYTPPGQLPSQLFSVLQHIWHEDQQCLSTPGSCPAQMQQPYADIGDSCSQPLTSHQYSSQQQEQQQEAVYPGPTNPLPFIATTSRHSMCMRRPSGKLSCGGSPLAGSFSSSSFGGGAQPLPSPAESPLARRLSERDGAGFPTSPQLVELLSSGRRLQRGLSLDSRRSVSTPGSTRSSLEAQHQHQQQHPQSAPWSGLQLRSVAHLLQQRQQQQQQEGSLPGDAAPWYRADRLECRHTFSSSMELSVAVGGAAAAHDFAAAAAAAVGSCHSSSKPPYRRLMTTMMRSSSGGSSCSGTDGVASPSLTSAGSLTPHRLSCCSSATNPLLDTAACNKEDAAAGSLACKSYKELFALWSANERGQQQEQQ